MKCSEIIKLIPQYANNELSQAQINEFNSHLLVCPNCRAALEDYQFLHSKSRQPDATMATPDIVFSTMNKIKAMSGIGTTDAVRKPVYGWLRLALVVTSIIMVALVLVVFLASYLPGQTGSSISTRITLQDEDEIIHTSGLQIRRSMNDLISDSDAIVIGKVTDILPSRKGTFGQKEREIIYTDVIVQAERYLHGDSESEKIAIRVYGGRIDNLVMWVEDSPEFIVGESILVFLVRPLYGIEPVPQGIDSSSYYVTSIQGKYRYWHGILTNWPGGGFPTCTWFIEMKIAAIYSK